ncbi:MAG: NADH-quinone oxidoreductase subunit L [Oligoflexia bacterium]|nr:NADH-quinone oxidoreductase subunit L [Oligoflexia bacterium]
MPIIVSLVIIPSLMAITLWLIKRASLQRTLVFAFAFFIIVITSYFTSLALFPEMFSRFFPFLYPRVLSLFPLAQQLSAIEFSTLQQHFLFVAEILISCLIFYFGVKYRRYSVAILSVAQLAVTIYIEVMIKNFATGTPGLVEGGMPLALTMAPFYLDNLSLIMFLIIGVIGGLIAIYSNGYMKVYHQHLEEAKVRDPESPNPDSLNKFFFLIFLFLSAMFGIVISNNLLWLLLFWEVTTLCSFLLIKYKSDKESVANAFRALIFNMVGGLAFGLGIAILFAHHHTLNLDQLISLGRGGFLFPVALLAIAGFTKSAQVPCTSWLLGAMVAPTPVSALLHSSTMVKAGVFLIVKLSPALEHNSLGLLVAMIGITTFLITSFIAVSRQNAKALLAYSTIANLGLIVVCAGVGGPTAVWAGITIILFHAISKGLLFLGVGVVEHQVGSKEIENMDGLVVKHPRLALVLIIGMAGMFLAPFALLISKWMVLKAIIDFSPIIAIPLVFGSAATIFYWSKWMGKLLQQYNYSQSTDKLLTQKHDVHHDTHHQPISSYEWFALYPLALLTFISIALITVISKEVIEPYLMSEFRQTFLIDNDALKMMLLVLLSIILLPFISKYIFGLGYKKRTRMVGPYLSGLNLDQKNYSYKNSFSENVGVQLKNYYINEIFSERTWYNVGIGASVALLILMIYISWIAAPLM